MESAEQQRSNLLSAVTVNFIKAKQAIRMSGTLPSDTSPESYHNNADPEMDSAKRLQIPWSRGAILCLPAPFLKSGPEPVSSQITSGVFSPNEKYLLQMRHR